jgi:hypothetical protein
LIKDACNAFPVVHIWPVFKKIEACKANRLLAPAIEMKPVPAPVYACAYFIDIEVWVACLGIDNVEQLIHNSLSL